MYVFIQVQPWHYSNTTALADECMSVTDEVASPFYAMPIKKKKQLPLTFSTNAGSSIGLGGIYRDHCFSHAFPDNLLSLPAEIQSTAHFQLCPVVVVCGLGSKLHRMTNMVFCLNEAIPLIKSNSLFHSFSARIDTYILFAAHIPSLNNRKGPYFKVYRNFYVFILM